MFEVALKSPTLYFLLNAKPNKYTMAKGEVHVANITHASQVQEKCHACPPGVRCYGDIRAIDNYWGHEQDDGKLEFFPCPTGYCCSSQTTP